MWRVQLLLLLRPLAQSLRAFGRRSASYRGTSASTSRRARMANVGPCLDGGLDVQVAMGVLVVVSACPFCLWAGAAGSSVRSCDGLLYLGIAVNRGVDQTFKSIAEEYHIFHHFGSGGHLTKRLN